MRRYRVDSFERLVEALTALPTIGQKSAVRLAYHMVLRDNFSAIKLSHAIEEAVMKVRRCNRCHNNSTTHGRMYRWKTRGEDTYCLRLR